MIVTTTDLQNSFGKYLQLCRDEEIIITVKGIFGEFINWFRDKQCEPLGNPFDVTLYRLGNEKKINVIYIYLFRNHDIERVLFYKDDDRACSAVFPGLAVNREQVFG